MEEAQKGEVRADGAIRVKRVYEPAAPDDGRRVLVTRYWPRGVHRQAADEWIRELGTPPEMLKAYQDGKLSYAEFAGRYRTWLGCSGEAAAALERLTELAADQPVTLMTSFADLSRSHVPVLRGVLARRVLERLGGTALQASHRFRTIHLYSLNGTSAAVGEAEPEGDLRPVAEALVASGRALELADAESEGRSPECHAGSYSLLGRPVVYDGSLVGAVVAESEQIGPFSDRERGPIIRLAEAAGPFLVASPGSASDST